MGHHREDFLATLLKDYFVNTYYAEHGAYDYEVFRSHLARKPIDVGELVAMVRAECASTMAVQLPLSASVTLVRPMLYVAEDDLAQLVRYEDFAVYGSGCSHDSFRNSTARPTKRELVHSELHRRLSAQPSLADDLLRVALASLDGSGRALFNPRQSRADRCPGFSA